MILVSESYYVRIYGNCDPQQGLLFTHTCTTVIKFAFFILIYNIS